MSSNLKVYRDKEYTTSWISHTHAREIANYLQKYKFDEIKAEELGIWMKEVISNDTKNTVVVFAQDVAPDTVFEDIGATVLIDNMGATVLIRQYLDFGGRVVWIGDMPFSYQGKKGIKNPEELKKTYLFSWDNLPGEDSERLLRFLKDDLQIGWTENAEIRKSTDGKTIHILNKNEIAVEIMLSREDKATLKFSGRTQDLEVKTENDKLNIYKKAYKNAYPYQSDLRGSSITVLSVIPIFLYAPRRPVEITKRGRKWGLKTVWSSLRPIVIDKKTRELTKYFAKTEGLIANLSIKYKKTGSLNWLKRNFRRIKSFSIGVGEVSIEAEIDEDKEKISKNPLPECYEKYASAWFKNFNKEEPNSGFVRIWDFSPRVITKNMKDELLQVATHIITIKKKASTGARLGSYIIDSIIVGIFGLILSFALCAAFWDVSDVIVPIASLLGLLLIHLVYFTCLFRNGRTVGMKIVKIKLYRIDETDTIGYKKGLLRGIGMIISGLVIGLGYLWILGENEQGWHDKIAGTYVGVE